MLWRLLSFKATFHSVTLRDRRRSENIPIVHVFGELTKDNRDITIAALFKVCIFGYWDDIRGQANLA